MKIINKYLREALSNAMCIKHPVAAVIETVKAEYVLGWNGPPAGIVHDRCLREGCLSGEGMEICPTVHAERRAISHAARDGIALDGGVIYLTGWFPCADCAKSIIEAGWLE